MCTKHELCTAYKKYDFHFFPGYFKLTMNHLLGGKPRTYIQHVPFCASALNQQQQLPKHPPASGSGLRVHHGPRLHTRGSAGDGADDPAPTQVRADGAHAVDLPRTLPQGMPAKPSGSFSTGHFTLVGTGVARRPWAARLLINRGGFFFSVGEVFDLTDVPFPVFLSPPCLLLRHRLSRVCSSYHVVNTFDVERFFPHTGVALVHWVRLLSMLISLAP